MFKTILATHQTTVISAKKLIFAGDTSPETLFSHFAHQPWAMWLDSGNSDHVDSRFDILVWQPIATLTTQGNSTDICFPDKNTRDKSTDDPLVLLKELQAQLFTTPNAKSTSST